MRSSLCAVAALAAAVVACSKLPSAPTTSTTTTSVPQTVTLTAPSLSAPADDAQLDTLPPTLTVTNATANVAGTRTHEFQIADSQNFTIAGLGSAYHAVVTTKTGVAEGGGGATSFPVESDVWVGNKPRPTSLGSALRPQ